MIRVGEGLGEGGVTSAGRAEMRGFQRCSVPPQHPEHRWWSLVAEAGNSCSPKR